MSFHYKSKAWVPDNLGVCWHNSSSLIVLATQTKNFRWKIGLCYSECNWRCL